MLPQGGEKENVITIMNRVHASSVELSGFNNHDIVHNSISIINTCLTIVTTYLSNKKCYLSCCYQLCKLKTFLYAKTKHRYPKIISFAT